MSKTPWTPGPWGFDGMSVFDDDGDPICHMAVSITEEDGTEQDANARLIAAAPEMAEVIALLLATRTLAPLDPARVLVVDEARALLARIRGDAA